MIRHFATPTTSLRINTSLVSSGQTLYQAAPLDTNTYCCSASLQNLVGNSEETQCLEEAEQQAEVSVDVPYHPLQIVNSVPFCLFSLYLILSLLPFSILSLVPLFWSILCPPQIKTSRFITFCFTNGTYFCILFHTMTYFFNHVFYKLVKKHILMLELQLVIPWGLEEAMATSQGRI